MERAKVLASVDSGLNSIDIEFDLWGSDKTKSWPGKRSQIISLHFATSRPAGDTSVPKSLKGEIWVIKIKREKPASQYFLLANSTLDPNGEDAQDLSFDMDWHYHFDRSRRLKPYVCSHLCRDLGADQMLSKYPQSCWGHKI